MNKLPIILALLFVSISTWADVYKCVENGRVSYSQHPCANNADETQVKIKQQQNNGATDARLKHLKNVEQFSKTLETSRLTRQYKYEIAEAQKKIKKLKKQKAKKVAELQKNQRHAQSYYSVEEFNKLKKLAIHKVETDLNRQINQQREFVNDRKTKLRQLPKQP